MGVLALAHFFDYASFLVMIGRHGLAAEANPVVVLLHQEIGLAGLTVAKIAFVAVAAALMFIIATRRRHLATGLFLFGVMAGVVGSVSNIATI